MQTNLPKLSGRAKQALDVLADGGRFVRRLERDSYTGFEKWQYRLQRTAAWSSTVKGVGFSAFHELQDAGFLVRDFGGGSSVTEPYKLNTEAA